jgi:hypothetical protein
MSIILYGYPVYIHYFYKAINPNILMRNPDSLIAIIYHIGIQTKIQPVMMQPSWAKSGAISKQ